VPLTRANATEAVDAGRSVRISVQVSNPADKRDERVLDFTNYTGDPFSPYDPAPQQIKLKLAFTGEDINMVERSIFLSRPPAIRCDKKMAVNGGDGCVYAQAPAVYVLTVGGPEKEAAEHIRDAQAANSRGGLTLDGDRYLAATSNALQRTRFPNVNNNNRNAACELETSLRVTRPATASASCQQNLTGCQCDEYPYASTWNGAFFDRPGTSVRFIRGPDNRNGGTKHQQFLQAERVLDLTVTETSSANGENFWVHIE
jgi:hypothetical protein